LHLLAPRPYYLSLTRASIFVAHLLLLGVATLALERSLIVLRVALVVCCGGRGVGRTLDWRVHGTVVIGQWGPPLRRVNFLMRHRRSPSTRVRADSALCEARANGSVPLEGVEHQAGQELRIEE